MSGDSDDGKCRPIYTERQQSFQSSRAALTVLLGEPNSGYEDVYVISNRNVESSNNYLLWAPSLTPIREKKVQAVYLLAYK